jgi:hypothetical protein
MAVFRRDDNQSSSRSAQPQSQPQRSIVGGISSSYMPVQAAPFNSPRPLTAAAAQLNVADKGEAERFRARRASGVNGWQQEAWEYYDAIGEIKYAFNLVASVVSRIRLYAAVIDNPAQAPSPIRDVASVDDRLSAAAERALIRLDSAYGGQAGLLRDAALNLSVTGECYLVQIPARAGHGVPESWDIRSVDELLLDQKGNYFIQSRRDSSGMSAGSQTANKPGNVLLPKGAFVGRIWRAHPRYSEEADSSLRGLLDLCAELLLLNRTFRATARSRLNAGALYLPDGLSVAAGPDTNFPYDVDGQYSDPTPEELQDEFEDQLVDAMTTPIRDEESASAVVPLIIRGPAELGDKIKQFKFERSFDASLVQRADRVLERILQGLDVPKDVVTGLANVKYSNALQIDEALYKAHIEPLMLLIADAITIVYLRPYLKANGFDEAAVDRIVVWFDPSQVATRNDRAADADSGFEKMAISFETWRRAHGFADADAPDAKEIALRLLFEKAAISPDLTESMLGALAPEVMDAARAASQAANPAPMPQNIADALSGMPAAPAAPTEPTQE